MHVPGHPDVQLLSAYARKLGVRGTTQHTFESLSHKCQSLEEARASYKPLTSLVYSPCLTFLKTSYIHGWSIIMKPLKKPLSTAKHAMDACKAPLHLTNRSARSPKP